MSDLWSNYISKQKAKIEAYPLLGPKRANQVPQLFTMTVNIDGVLVAGDGQAQLVVPVDCRPVSASMSLETAGTKSAAEANDVVLGYNAVGGADPSGGALTIADTATDPASVSTDILDSTWNDQKMAAGDILYLNIDSVAGAAAPTNLTVTVSFITR